MIESAYRLASSLEVESRRQELTAQNIAGAQIPGYKARHLSSHSFQKALADQTEDPTMNSYGVKATDPKTHFGDGAIKNTSRPLDFALSGDGFFRVQTSEGQDLLTRTGRFQLDADGTLRTGEGHAVMAEGGQAVELPRDISLRNLSVREDGTLQVVTPGEGAETLDKLDVATVDDKQQLTRLSAKYYKPQDQQELIAPQSQDVTVRNKCYEDANISPVREMTEMIHTARRFQMGNKMIKMLRTISQQEARKMS